MRVTRVIPIVLSATALAVTLSACGSTSAPTPDKRVATHADKYSPVASTDQAIPPCGDITPQVWPCAQAGGDGSLDGTEYGPVGVTVYYAPDQEFATYRQANVEDGGDCPADEPLCLWESPTSGYWYPVRHSDTDTHLSRG